MDVSEVVRSAGGVVWRSGGDGAVEVALVHRPKYDDWSFPKGKLHDGEAEEEAALREVGEETGLRCTLGLDLGHTSYRDSQDRPKTVRYWEMTPAIDELAPTKEVDEARWASLDDAARLLSYERDRELLGRFEAVVVRGTAE